MCTIAGGQGTLTADYEGVVVTCAEETFPVSVQVNNLWNTSGSLVLTLNGTQNLPIHANGVHTFPIGLVHGASYSVVVTSQPSWDEECYVTSGTGTVNHAPVSGIMVDCYWWY